MRSGRQAAITSPAAAAAVLIGVALAVGKNATPAAEETDRAAIATSRASSASEFDRRALDRIESPPLGLPKVPVPPENRPTIEKIRLGRSLFLDRRLSVNGTLSCAMCHVPEQGFTVNEVQTAVGHEGKSLRRNAPTLLNTAFAAPFFHDGREPGLDLQPINVLVNPDEMAMPSLGAIVSRVRAIPRYDDLFEEAFGAPASVESVGKAIGTYLRSLLSADSPFDRWHFMGDDQALGDGAKRGFEVFTEKARCVRCHHIAADQALFTDGSFHDTGLGRFNSVVRTASRDPVMVELAPGVTVPMARSTVASVGEPRRNDLGRYEVTGDPADRWKFKTPSLRNVALTAPYMHDGSFSTLREVIDFYQRGGHPHEGIDPLIRPLDLDDRDVEGLLAFLASLTGSNTSELIADARSQEIGNPAPAASRSPTIELRASSDGSQRKRE